METGKSGWRSVPTPMDPHKKVRESKEEPVLYREMYHQRLVGETYIFSSHLTGHSYSVNVISQFMPDPWEPQTMNRVLRYLMNFKKRNVVQMK